MSDTDTNEEVLPMSGDVADADQDVLEVEGKSKQAYLADADAHRANNRPEAAEECERLAEDAPDDPDWSPEADAEVEVEAEAVEEDVPYIDWTAEELRAEIDRRNEEGSDLAVSGTKADMAERLEADDTAE